MPMAEAAQKIENDIREAFVKAQENLDGDVKERLYVDTAIKHCEEI
jgi:hypothetical protein